MTAIILASVLSLITAAMVVLQFPGRRMDDHPVCRKCGYDLFGRIDFAGKCPECGQDLAASSAIRLGNRHRDLAKLGVACLLFMLCLTGLIVGVAAQVQSINQIELVPTWCLRLQIRYFPSSTKSIAEIDRRFKAHELSANQIDGVADAYLSVQGDPSSAWSVPLADFLETSQRAGRLDDQRWNRYVTTAFKNQAFVTQPQVSYGSNLPITMSALPFRGSFWLRNAFARIEDMRIDGAEIGPLEPRRMSGNALEDMSYWGTWSEFGAILGSGGIRIPSEMIAILPPGEHDFSLVLALRVRDFKINHQDAPVYLRHQSKFTITGQQPTAPADVAHLLELFKQAYRFDGGFQSNSYFMVWDPRNAKLPELIKCELFVRDKTGQDHPVVAKDAAGPTPAQYWLGSFQEGFGYVRGISQSDIKSPECAIVIRAVNPQSAAKPVEVPVHIWQRGVP